MISSEPSAGNLLDRLSEKEREVLDRVIQHKPTKQIARELKIAPNTVDMRLKSVRSKLGTKDRNETARLYQQLLADCGKTTCGPAVMAAGRSEPLLPSVERPDGGVFTFEDSASFRLPVPWTDAPKRSLTEVLDDRFGRAWRVAAIPSMALAIALLALALLAIATTLGALV
ncbi:MAG TPA: helix-turn-helix transcriptional regulator [Croceibacterium sp.]|nr:helix-turn-helix transcriptional regulator [Croceibacterium sp.]